MSHAKDFSSQKAHVDSAAINPLPNSEKIYVQGSRDDIRVPMRKISQDSTPTDMVNNGGQDEENPPIYVYDTSGPYTDPHAQIDIRKGLPALRQKWIDERDDTQMLEAQPAIMAKSVWLTKNLPLYALTCSARRAVPSPVKM